MMLLGGFGLVLTLILGAGLLGLYLAERRHRRVRGEVGIPWTTNGHGTSAMYREMIFQETVLRINARLTHLEAKANDLETIMMQRAFEED